MNIYKGKNVKKLINLSDRAKKLIKKIAIIGFAGTVAVTPIAKETSERKSMKKIEESAQIEEAFRSFRNIDQENMGDFLKMQIERLYDKYPNIDDMVYKSSEETRKMDFIQDIYTLYKAFMVDKSKKIVQDIYDVKVSTDNKIITSSDIIKAEDKKLIQTHKEQYKHITDKYVQAEESTNDGAELAREMYELLAYEMGLKENVLTSKEIAEIIERDGFYYDEKRNEFFTKEGKGNLVIEKREQETQKEDEEEERG